MNHVSYYEPFEARYSYSYMGMGWYRLIFFGGAEGGAELLLLKE